MAITATPYGPALLNLGKARFDFTADTFKVALAGSGYTPDEDTDEFFDDITNEIAGVGYLAGGATLTGLVWAYSAAANTVVLTANPTVWTSASFTFRYAVVYKSTGTAATSPLLSYVDLGADKSPANYDLKLTWPTTGLLSAALV